MDGTDGTDEHTHHYFVPGIPAPKGSWNAIWNPHVRRSGGKKGACILVSQNPPATKAWSKAIRSATMAARVPRYMEGPILCDITFWLPRAEATSWDWIFRDIRPDKDKLERLVLDALTGVAWRDDAQVCDGRTRKLYVTDGHPETGADITIRLLTQNADTLF